MGGKKSGSTAPPPPPPPTPIPDANANAEAQAAAQAQTNATAAGTADERKRSTTLGTTGRQATSTRKQVDQAQIVNAGPGNLASSAVLTG